jgi:pentatricopeptide repeat protein
MRQRGLTPDARCYTVVIAACARFHHAERALQLLADMRSAGVAPNTATYAACISACASQGWLGRAQQLMEELRGGGLQPDGFCYAALIDAHVAKGRAAMGDQPQAGKERSKVLGACNALARQAKAAIEGDTETEAAVLKQASGAVNAAVMGAHVALGDHEGALHMVHRRHDDKLYFNAACYRHAVSATLRAAGGAGLGLSNDMVPSTISQRPGGAAQLEALNAAFALCEEAASLNVKTHLDTRREMLMFAACVAGGAEEGVAGSAQGQALTPLAAFDKLMRQQFHSGGFLSNADTHALMLQLLRPEVGTQGVRLCLQLWQNLRPGTAASVLSARLKRLMLGRLPEVEGEAECAPALAAVRSALQWQRLVPREGIELHESEVK